MSRFLRTLWALAGFAVAAGGVWLGLQHLLADGPSLIDAAVVGLAAFVVAVVVVFSRR